MKEQLKNKENKLKILPLLAEKDMNTSSKILEESKKLRFRSANIKD